MWKKSDTGDFDVVGAVTSWYNEINNYSYDTRACSSVCGHYTQVREEEWVGWVEEEEGEREGG